MAVIALLAKVQVDQRDREKYNAVIAEMRTNFTQKIGENAKQMSLDEDPEGFVLLSTRVDGGVAGIYIR
jgi:hypothetical protein